MKNLFDEALPILEDRWGKGNYAIPLEDREGTAVCAVGGLCAAANPEFEYDYLYNYSETYTGELINEIEHGIYSETLVKAIHELYPNLEFAGRAIKHPFEFNDHPDVTKEDVLSVFHRASELWNEALAGKNLVSLH